MCCSQIGLPLISCLCVSAKYDASRPVPCTKRLNLFYLIKSWWWLKDSHAASECQSLNIKPASLITVACADAILPFPSTWKGLPFSLCLCMSKSYLFLRSSLCESSSLNLFCKWRFPPLTSCHSFISLEAYIIFYIISLLLYTSYLPTSSPTLWVYGMIYVVFCQLLLFICSVPGIMLHLCMHLPYLTLPVVLDRKHLHFTED